MEDLDLFKEICETHAPSGREDWLYSIIEDNFNQFGDITISKLNNMYIHKEGKTSSKLMIMSHADEIFLMVKEITKEGFIKFKGLGIDAKSLVAQEVIIHGKENVSGVVGLKYDYSGKQKNKVSMENLYIETGFCIEKLRSLIKVGDYITLDRNMVELLNDNVSCKSIDNRASIFAMYICAEELKNVNPDLNVYFVCSCQEEVGHRGAKMASYEVKPDIGIALDVTFDGGTLGDSDRENKLGAGPVICIGPNIHTKIKNRIIQTADKYNIPYQIEVEPGNTGTDAWDIQTAEGGIPTLLISIPIKYMHTSVEVVNLKDIKNTGRLLARFIQELKEDELEGLFCF
ncbi:putative aminopeptidase YsdC [Clostridium ragsdalei P11]|uniref:Putative aminopeptidase YsdC n=1 Tax=Clostridium ragsdalei P11 TaxID=1353534 RepID=A0A1A6AMV4_9CLOT|nr:M20/M25/M40 family metallo-hydrolase [Clostridium ragsdalei]OBR91353.1 putative aminopeptidase YsdC [Clostridium ragsdalei P11]